MTPGSGSTAIHILLEELEEAFEAHVVNLPAGDHFKPGYVAINPKSTIPALVRSDGTVLTEVPAIAYWLGRSRARAGLWPSTLEAETRAIEAMAYVTGTVHGQGFARIFATGTFAKNPADHAEVQALGLRIVERGFSILDATVPEEGFVAGGFSVADPVLFYVEFWADKTSMPLPPKLAAHYQKMLTRPAVRRVLREEGYDLGKLGQGLQ
jgi:glutathione S-transferase